MILFDTTVLIDLEREFRKRIDGPATAALRTMPEERPAISTITVGEFAEGFVERTFEFFSDRLRPYTVLPLDTRIAWRYGVLSRTMRRKGNRVGDNDLWIAATALERTIPLLTRNVRHFSRIDGLDVRGY
ncbi:MAG: type II toxin-antitoxin system VapC family toxin [Spirochaetales bacterium]|nr:type II toxin-antitoxin system VapC family toxin [Spirochaetales bacterium]